MKGAVSTALSALLTLGDNRHYANAAEGCAVTTEWLGWNATKHAFIFGDSYSQTGFNVTFEAPSPSNPLGNPTYPGWTSSNGPNWVDFLTVKHNNSKLLTYNLAYGGATVDSSLVAPWKPEVLSLIDQVETLFLPTYVPPDVTPASPSWTSRDTLFGIWIGINDVGNSYYKGTNVTNALYPQIFAKYADMVDKLYSGGGRNFVFLNVPPVDLSPLTIEQGKDSMDMERASIADFNKMTENLAKSVKTAHGEVNVWLVDTNDIFLKVLAHPPSYPQTAGYKNTTAFCTAYQNGTPKQDSFDPSCGIKVDEYFWLNSLHPTYPIHDVVAEQVAKAVSGVPNVCPETKKE